MIDQIMRPFNILERDRTQNRIPLLLVALLPDLADVPDRFLARYRTMPCASGAWAACGIRPPGARHTIAGGHPIDHTNGGPPPAAGRRVTGIWRPQPAARPSNNPSRTFAQAG